MRGTRLGADGEGERILEELALVESSPQRVETWRKSLVAADWGSLEEKVCFVEAKKGTPCLLDNGGYRLAAELTEKASSRVCELTRTWVLRIAAAAQNETE